MWSDQDTLSLEQGDVGSPTMANYACRATTFLGSEWGWYHGKRRFDPFPGCLYFNIMNLSAFGVNDILEIAKDPECVFYQIDNEVYAFLDGLHVFIAEISLVEEYEYVRIGGHPVDGHWKSSSRQSEHWVDGYHRGGSMQRRITGYKEFCKYIEPEAFVGQYDCESQKPTKWGIT